MTKRQAIIGAVVVAVLTGAAAFFAYRGPGLAPEEVMRRMAAASAEVRTFTVSISLEAQLDLTRSPRAKEAALLLLPSSSSVYGVTTDGAYDLTDPARPRFAQKIALYKSDEGQRIEAAFDMLGTGDEYFARLTRAPLLPLPTDLNAFAGKWVSLGAASSTAWDPAGEAARLRTELSSSTPFRITKTFPVASLEGVASYHYGFALEGKGLTEGLRRMAELAGRPAPAAKDVADLSAFLDGVTGEIWIGKADLRPRRVTAVMPFTEDGVTYGTGRLQATFGGFNEPVAVEAPPSAMTLEELVRSVFDAPAFAPTARIDLTP